MKLPLFSALLAVSLTAAAVSSRAADSVKPLRVLLVTGGCCHDYARQKEILKAGLVARANVSIDEVYSAVVIDQALTADKTDKPSLPMIYGNPEYARGYDCIIHDECTTGGCDEAVVRGVLKPHREDGIPGVNLHCGVHAYRIGNPNLPATEPGAPHSLWFEYLGLQSSQHDAQEPIAVTYTDKDSPIIKGLGDWTTIKEEHYNNIKVFDTAHPLAQGVQTVHVKKKNPDGTTTVTGDRTDTWVDVWTNIYNGKTRVFSTTIGHNNETVADPRYLDLVTRGLLWATGHLNDDGTPAPGYGPGGK